MRSKQLVHTTYNFCAWATYCVRDSTTFARKWLLLQVLTLLFVWSEIVRWLGGLTEGLLVSSLVRSVIMRVTWSFMNFLMMTFRAIWSNLIGLYCFWVRMERSVGLYGFWVSMEQSNWLVQLLILYGTICLACTDFESVWNDLIGLYGK